MNEKTTIKNDPEIKIKQNRYEDLLRKEERLNLIENAIKKGIFTGDLKTIFGLDAESDVIPNVNN